VNKILIVDDEQRIVDILESFLKMNGFDVLKATGGEEAIRLLSSDAQFDLMLLDMRMPKVNGLGVMQKKVELGKKFPVLFLMGTIDVEKCLEALKDKGVTAEDILCKPIDLPVLLEKAKKKLNIA
jgi:DNA-binding response OmpR family regulator